MTSLLAFGVTTPVLIASCTQAEYVETSGMLNCRCQSDGEATSAEEL